MGESEGEGEGEGDQVLDINGVAKKHSLGKGHNTPHADWPALTPHPPWGRVRRRCEPRREVDGRRADCGKGCGRRWRAVRRHESPLPKPSGRHLRGNDPHVPFALALTPRPRPRGSAATTLTAIATGTTTNHPIPTAGATSRPLLLLLLLLSLGRLLDEARELRVCRPRVARRRRSRRAVPAA